MFKPYQLRWLHRLHYGLEIIPLISTRSLRKRLTNYIMTRAEDGLAVPTLYGFSLFVDPKSDTGLDRAIFMRGTYEPGTLKVIRDCLAPGQVFIDVGSNIGLMTLLAAQSVGAGGLVYSIEADPGNFSILERNLALNRASNVLAYNLGMSSAPGRGMIYRARQAKRSSALAPIAETTETEGIPIELQTLDAFLAGQARTDVRMLKVDVKGWELEVLKGANGLLSGPEAPILCLSYLKDQLGPAFYTYLRELNGYRVFKLAGGKTSLSRLQELTSATDLPDDDNLFCFRPSHRETLPSRLFAR